MLEMVREDYVGDADSRALADLDANAKAMHARLVEAEEIYLALQRQAALWRQLGAELPDDAALQVIRRLPALGDWQPAEILHDTDGIEPVRPCEPFYWKYLSPEDAAKRTKEALEWFDTETRVRQEQAAHEARVQKLRRQPPRRDLSDLSQELRELVADIVSERIAEELPAAMLALQSRKRHGA